MWPNSGCHALRLSLSAKGVRSLNHSALGCAPHDRFRGIMGSFHVAGSKDFAKSAVPAYGFTDCLYLRFIG